MDVAAIRNELEQHLENNPHPQAPSGFRDRFDAVVAEMESGDDDFPRSVLEAQLQQIRDEAKAAAAAAQADEGPASDTSRNGAAPDASDDAGMSGQSTLQRLGVPIAIILVILAAGYFLLR